MHSWRATCLLATLALSLPSAQAYSPTSGSAVAGNLDAIAGPYGIPPDKFRSATSHADASAAFDITGYNVSAAATGNSPVAVAGWKLTARVTLDVSLSDATNGSSSSSSSQKNSEATTLYLEAPEGMTMGAAWRICAVVYPGTASEVANSTAVDGTCNGVLSTECIQALTASAGGSGDTGMDNGGTCTNFELPSRCTDGFPEGSGNMSAISESYFFHFIFICYPFPPPPSPSHGRSTTADTFSPAINQTVLDNKRFYAYASDPTSSDNSTAEVEAKDNVWPVITIFGHVSSGGQLSSANTAVQCVRAINGTAEDDIGSSALSRMGGKTSLFAAAGAAFVATWMCVF